jgi:hypothetical protein
MTRTIEPELLDALADDHPDALASRSDLLKVNWIMGNHHWMLRTLKKERKPGERICEIGAGDGALSQKIVQNAICSPNELHAVDLASQPKNWPQAAIWHQGDLFATQLPDCEILIANLFLHHFRSEHLAQLGARLSPVTRLILAAEPARYRIHQITGGVISRLLGMHYVTRYDMQVSIRAGFRGDELPLALGLGSEWSSVGKNTFFGANRVVMSRDSAVRNA